MVVLQAEHRQVVGLEAKDEALRRTLGKDVGIAEENKRLKARIKELEGDERERERSIKSGEVSCCSVTLAQDKTLSLSVLLLLVLLLLVLLLLVRATAACAWDVRWGGLDRWHEIGGVGNV